MSTAEFAYRAGLVGIGSVILTALVAWGISLHINTTTETKREMAVVEAVEATNLNIHGEQLVSTYAGVHRISGPITVHFKCEHGRFGVVVRDDPQRTRWAQFKPGERVSIVYRELKDENMNTERVDFIDAELLP